MVSGVASVCSRVAIVTPSPKTSPSCCTRSPNRLLKNPRSPFDKLRANGAGIAIVGDLPFVLSLSKHENDFFSTLLRLETWGLRVLSVMSSVSAISPSSLFSSLRSSLLIALTVAYLLGQVCAAWGWVIFSPLWLGGVALLAVTAWFCGGRGLAAFVACLLLTFSLANAVLQRVIAPHLPPVHLRHLALPQQVTIEGWLFREPERFPHRGRLYLEALRVWQDGALRPATGKILVTV